LKTDVFAAIAFPWILTVEGRYSKDPRDRGNWTGGKVDVGELRGTKYGIAASSHPTLDIENLTHEQAAEIYRREYWNPLRCDELPPAIALAVFDDAVNQGPRAAANTLQLALRVPIDGEVGPETLAAAGFATIEAFLPEFLSYRAFSYASTPGAAHYLRGWMLRLFRLELACLRLGGAISKSVSA
jgi:lysozyme family protein